MVSPGWLAASPLAPPPSTTFAPITATAKLGYDTHLGFELGGPIVRDHAWFFVGFAPTLDRTDVTRTTQRETDCRAVITGNQLTACDPMRYGDGQPDVDPKTGVPITDVLDRAALADTSRAYSAIAKLDVAPSSSERGMISVLATPSTSTAPEIQGLASSGTRSSELTTDSTARWTSKLRGDSLELTAQLGWHRDAYQTGAIDPALDGTPQELRAPTSLAGVLPFGGESAATATGCTDGGATDPYPNLTNCPNPSTYATGGPGAIERTRDDRYSARIAATDRFRALGTHAVTLGAEAELEETSDAYGYSGGAFIQDLPPPGPPLVYRPIQLAPIGSVDPSFDQRCAIGTASAGMPPPTLACKTFDGLGPTITNETRDWAAYLHDAWQVRSNLSVQLGVRYDSQRLLYGSDVRDATDPLTRIAYGTTAATLHGSLAPRVGVVYDPTGVGRAKLFASWSRYTEPLLLDVNQNALSAGPLVASSLFPLSRDGVETIAPGLRPEFLDEAAAGAQVERGGFTLGASLRDRRLHDVVEDVFDGTQMVLGNPGLTPGTHGFDVPTRIYDALELTVAHPFWHRLFVQASYVYSRTSGDYPGSASYDNGQIAPNLSTQYDQYTSNANRRGLLPQDRPHYVKLDAYYVLQLDRDSLTFGARFRALSGTPIDVLGPNDVVGPNEVFLLPRGAFGRTDFDAQLDLHVGYTRALRRHTALDVFVDVFNVYDGQGTVTTDEAYATLPNTTVPISGGRYADLIWLKNGESPTPVTRNPDFGAPTSRYAPLSAQLGARLTF